MGELGRTKLALVAAGLASFASMAQAAQGGFTTWERVFWATTGTNPPLFKEERAVDCALPGETLDAQADPNGNWGFPNEGIQLSVRFEKVEFRVGEPIVASIIVRNVHDTLRMSGTTTPDQTEFVLTDEKGRRAPRKDLAAPDAPFAERLRGTSPRAFGGPLPVGRQLKYKLILSDTFNLTAPGTYELRAIKNIPKLDESGYGQVMSGSARFQVVASKGTDASKTEPSASHATNAIQTSRSIAAANGQTTGIPAELTSTRATTQPTNTASSTPGNHPQADSSPARSEASGTHLGVASGAVRIGASLLVLLFAAGLVYVVVRRARRRAKREA